MGVYAIWTKSVDSEDWQLRYIGKASDLKSRVSGHFKTDKNRDRKRTPAYAKIREAQEEGLQFGVSILSVQDNGFYSLVESKLITRVRDKIEVTIQQPS